MSAVALGGGKYDPELRAAQASVRAAVTVLIVVGGDRGDGFALAVDERFASPTETVAHVPAILRAIASAIEEQQRGMS